MNLWNMSISGGILIAVIVIVRSLFRQRLPQKVFQILWLAAFLRLMIPFSIPCQFNIYTLAENLQTEFLAREIAENEVSEDAVSGKDLSAIAKENVAVYVGNEALHVSKSQIYAVWMLVYLGGVGMCVLYYVISYIRWRREFQMALPIEKSQIQEWADTFPIRQRISVRQWEMTTTPLAYGVIHPVILLPKSWKKMEREQLKFVLVHEYMHIRHFDSVKKMFLILTCCVHWFNPMVWVMLVLANRDMELECDENVIKYLGGNIRTAYAYALIDMEEQRSFHMSWGNSFSENAMKERVVAIMKEKKKSIAIGVLSGVLTAGIILVFATSAAAMNSVQQEAYASTNDTTAEYEGVSVENVMQEQTYAIEDVAEYDALVYKEDSAESLEQEQTDVIEDVAEYSGDRKMEKVETEIPKEYASYDITSDARSGRWNYQGKPIAVFYDKGRYTMTNDTAGESPVYLEVCRDKKGRVEDIKEVSKKEMQELLSHTGLVFE